MVKKLGIEHSRILAYAMRGYPRRWLMVMASSVWRAKSSWEKGISGSRESPMCLARMLKLWNNQWLFICTL
ncbi:hypothetical protein HMPREF3193_00616 [Bifidobacterium breve]|nr:hypothetical protein HMPREF3193_00616 [Bifidobacterium breve]RDX25576.1 hypothetical protein CE160_05575 [Bifidobacterium breve]